jgi:hypothetical protein
VTRIARPVVVKKSVEIAATPEVAFDYCVDLGGSSVEFMFLKESAGALRLRPVRGPTAWL